MSVNVDARDNKPYTLQLALYGSMMLRKRDSLFWLPVARQVERRQSLRRMIDTGLVICGIGT